MDIETHVINEREVENQKALGNSESLFNQEETIKDKDYSSVAKSIFDNKEVEKKVSEKELLFLEEPEYNVKFDPTMENSSMYIFSILITIVLILSYYLFKKVVKRNAVNAKGKQKV